MRGEKLKRRRKKKTDPQNAQPREHLHGPRAFDQQQNTVNEERDDADVQQVRPPQAGLKIGEQIVQ